MISLGGIRLKGGWLVLALEIKAIQQNPFWVLVVCFVLSRYGKWFYICLLYTSDAADES